MMHLICMLIMYVAISDDIVYSTFLISNNFMTRLDMTGLNIQDMYFNLENLGCDIEWCKPNFRICWILKFFVLDIDLKKCPVNGFLDFHKGRVSVRQI